MSHLFVLLSGLGALLIAVLALYTVKLRSDNFEHPVHYLVDTEDRGEPCHLTTPVDCLKDLWPLQKAGVSLH